MQSRAMGWFLVLTCTLLFLAGLCMFFVDLVFFITRKEAIATVIRIEKKSNYKIELEYFNSKQQKSIVAVVKLKPGYKKEVEALGLTTTIYYSGVFPKDIYIKNCRVPQ